MMTSSNGNSFRVTGYLCGEFTGFCVTGHLCGEFTGPPVNSPHKGQWRGALMFSLICARIHGWVSNREAGDLRRHPTHCDVIVMKITHRIFMNYQRVWMQTMDEKYDQTTTNHSNIQMCHQPWKYTVIWQSRADVVYIDTILSRLGNIAVSQQGSFWVWARYTM